MKKKILFVLLAVCLALPCAFVLSACGKKDNSNAISRLELKYGDVYNSQMYMEYNYGEEIDVFEGLEVWATYMDGSKKDITNQLKEENVKYYKLDGAEEVEIDSIPIKPDVGTYSMKVRFAGQEVALSIWVAPVENPEGISFVVGGDNRYKYNEQDVSVEMRLNGVKENGNGFALYYLTAEDYAANCQGKSTEEKIAYLKEYVAAPETSANNLSLDEREDGRYLYFTEGLDNGNYYFFLYYYAFGNYDSGVTLPRAVTIAKGDFVLVNGATAEISATYSFSTFELEENVRLGDIEIVASDEITFLGYPATNNGYFKFVSENTTINGSNTSVWQIEYVFTNEDYAKNYDTSSFSRYIRPTLNKGVIERPYISTLNGSDTEHYFDGDNNKYVTTYNAQEQSITSFFNSYQSDNLSMFCNAANGTKTNAGDYSFTLTLKYANNYEWGMPVNASDDYYYGELNGATVSFAWEIKKADQYSYNYQSIHFIVGGEDSYSSEIDWVSGGEYTIRIIPGGIYPTNTTWTWSVYDRRDIDGDHDDSVASLASETTSGLENTVTFTKPGYFEIVLTNTGDENVNELVADVYYAQIIVRKAELAHKTDIEADIAAVTAQTCELTATNGQVLVPSNIIPASNYDEGSWELWYYDLGNKVVLTAGQDSEIDYVGNYTWHLEFVPTYPDCYGGISDSFEVTVIAKDFEDKAAIAAEVVKNVFDVNVMNFDNVEVPDILPSTSAYSALGEWAIFEGETRLYVGSSYTGATEPCVKNWNLVFVSSSTLYNDVTVPVTVKFRGPVDDYDNIYAEIVQTSFEQELIGDSVVVTRASLLPVTTHSALGEWKLFLNEEDYFIQDPEFSVTGTHEYLVRFVPNNDLYYGPGQYITLTIYGKVAGYDGLEALVETAHVYKMEGAPVNVLVADLLPANDANGVWKLYRESNEITSAQLSFNQVGEFGYTVKYVPTDTNKYGPEVAITITIRANIDNYNDIEASVTTAFGPYELEAGEYTLTYSSIIPTGYTAFGTWSLLDSNKDPINAVSVTFTTEGNYTYYVKFVPNEQYLDGPEVEVTVSVVDPAVVPSTLSAEDVAALKNDLGMGENDDTATIEFVDNGGSYIFDLPTTNLSVEGTLRLYYDNNGEATEYETGSELFETPTDYTWYFVYDVTDANYEDYRIDATATV